MHKHKWLKMSLLWWGTLQHHSGAQCNFVILLSVSAFINPSEAPEMRLKQKTSLPSLTLAVPLADF